MFMSYFLIMCHLNVVISFPDVYAEFSNYVPFKCRHFSSNFCTIYFRIKKS